MEEKKINSKMVLGILTLIVSIGINIFNYFTAENQKDKLKLSKAIEIHTDLKYKVEKYLNISQEIMQDKISIIYIHNNTVKAINMCKNIHHENQYTSSSYPEYASIDISKMKEEIKNKVQNINNKLIEMKELKSNIENTFEKLELFENNSNINEVKTSYVGLFNDLVNTMNIAYENSSKIQKNISTIDNVLIIDTDNKNLPDEFILSLKNDQQFYEILKKHSYKVRENLDLIDPRL